MKTGWLTSTMHDNGARALSRSTSANQLDQRDGVSGHWTGRDSDGLVAHRILTKTAERAQLNVCLALAALVALAGCSTEPPTHAACADYCARQGMAAVGFYQGAPYGNGCICTVEKPLDVTCGAAWSRADSALDLLNDCQLTLQACIDRTRGGGL